MMQTTKRLADQVDVKISCAKEFALFSPVEQISTVSWAVEKGDVGISDERNTAESAYVRVSGGTRLYSWHAIRATITTVGGQVYTPLIEIQLVR